MKKVNFVWIFAIALIVLPLVNATIPTRDGVPSLCFNANTSTKASDYKDSYFFWANISAAVGNTSGLNSTQYATTGPSPPSFNTNNGNLEVIGSGTGWQNGIISTKTNFGIGDCISFRRMKTVGAGIGHFTGIVSAGGGALFNAGDNYGVTTQDGGGGTNNVKARSNQGATETQVMKDTGTWHNITLCFISANNAFAYVNNTEYALTDTASATSFWILLNPETTGNTVLYEKILAFNYSTGCPTSPPPPPDTTAPVVSNAGFNLTTVKKNNMLNVSFNLTDETALSTANITANFSTGKQYINYTVSGTSASIWHNFSIDCVRGCVINFTGYATDSSNNVAQNSRLVTISNTAPTCTAGTINNTSPKTNDVINQTGCIYSDADGDAQGTSLFKWFLNLVEIAGQTLKTLNLATGGNGNKGQTINASEAPYDGIDYGNYVNVSVFATIANTAPSFSSSSISQLSPNTTTTLTGTTSGYSDADSDAESGSTYKWYKNTVVIGGQTTTSLAGTNFIKADVIIFEATPSDGTNSGSPVNSSSVVIVNTPPTVTSIGNGSDNNFNRNVTLGATASTDDDSDTLYYAFYFEAINPPTVLVQNTTSTTFTTNMTNETVYFVKVDVMDGTDKASGTVIFNLTLDTTTPSWQQSFISNGTFYRTSTNITYNCTDTNIFEVNTTVYNRAGTVQQRSIGYLNLTPSSGGSKTINLTIDTSLPDGEYNATRWCGDTKNKERAFSTMKHSVSTNNQTITFNDTASGVQLNITLGTENPAGIFIPATSQIGLQTAVQDIGGLTTSIYPDYFKFFTSALVPNDQFTLSIRFSSSQKGMEVFGSNLPNHLLFGSGKEKISADAEDLVNAGFGVTTWSENNFYYWRVTKGSNNYVNGQRVEFDPRIDNLNIIENSAIYIQDTSNPTINNITFTNFANNSFVSRNLINVTYNVSDAYNNSILFYVNGVKNATFGFISNSSQIATIPITIEGNYSILFEANDSANNKLNSSFLYVAIDTTAPSINNLSNTSSAFQTTSSVNISVIAGEIYGSTFNFQFNISNGSMNTSSITWMGNTTYSLLISGFTAGQVVGWNATAYDLAGNKLETSTFTFLVNAVPSSGGGGGGGGGGGSVTIPQSLLQSSHPFGTPSSDGTCKTGEQVLDGTCYPCNPETGYLKFNPEDRSVLCIICQEGFKKEGDSCVLDSPRGISNKLNMVLDTTAAKISSALNTTNPMAGYLVMIVIGALVANVVINELKKRPRNKDE